MDTLPFSPVALVAIDPARNNSLTPTSGYHSRSVRRHPGLSDCGS